MLTKHSLEETSVSSLYLLHDHLLLLLIDHWLKLVSVEQSEELPLHKACKGWLDMYGSFNSK